MKEPVVEFIQLGSVSGVRVSQLRTAFLGWKHNRAHPVPGLGEVNGVSACAVTVQPGRHR